MNIEQMTIKGHHLWWPSSYTMLALKTTVGFTVLVIMLVLAYVTAFPLSGFNNPQPLVSEREVRAGDSIAIYSVKCNRSMLGTTVEGQRFIRSMTTNETFLVAGGVAYFPANECIERVFENTVPEHMPADLYRFEGINTSRLSKVFWKTEPFRVFE